MQAKQGETVLMSSPMLKVTAGKTTAQRTWVIGLFGDDWMMFELKKIDAFGWWKQSSFSIVICIKAKLRMQNNAVPK